jgi:hypothetical protein
VSSGYDERDVIERFGTPGPTSILKKPFNAQMLLDQVQSILSV